VRRSTTQKSQRKYSGFGPHGLEIITEKTRSGITPGGRKYSSTRSKYDSSGTVKKTTSVSNPERFGKKVTYGKLTAGTRKGQKIKEKERLTEDYNSSDSKPIKKGPTKKLKK
jgi:hypothetical protein